MCGKESLHKDDAIDIETRMCFGCRLKNTPPDHITYHHYVRYLKDLGKKISKRNI